MKQSLRIALLTTLCSLGSIALTGCSGMGSATIPDIPSDVSPGPMTGSVFGGHSPIIGAEIYVLQAANAYNGTSANRLTAADAQGTDSSHSYYVLTGTSGTFSVSGDYTCTSGDPVYIAAVGGTTSPTAYLLPITFSSESGSSGHYTITFSYTGTNAPALNSYVTFASGAFTKSGFTNLNGTRAQVTAVSTGKFSVASNTTTKPAGPVTAYAVGDSMTTGAAANPAAINFAVLGNCPAAGNFAASVPFVFINEISTAAGAYALNGFGTGPFNIGGVGSNLVGIQNAAQTAGQLYSIATGYNALSNTSQGTNPTSASSNGVVPQATLDTIGNILAACVDSVNTATAPSTQCTDLFADAKNTAGAAPTDTATAAFNIAANPSRGSNTLVTSLFSLQASGSAPFTPSLSAAPNDYTLTIAYTGGGLGATNGKSPHSIAVDANGNIYSANYSDSSFSVFSPLGVPQTGSPYSGNSLSNPVAVAIDSTSSTLWVTNYSGSTISHFNIDGSPATYPVYSFGSNAYGLRDAQFDQGGNLWTTSDANNALYEITEGGRYHDQYNSTQVDNGLNTPYGVAIDQSDDVWMAQGNAEEASECVNDYFYYGCVNYAQSRNNTQGGINYPVGEAIDANGNAWFGNSSGTLTAFTTSFFGNVSPLTGSPFVTGADSLQDSVAIDGVDSVWSSNTDGNAIYAFTNTTNRGTTTVTELSPTSGYTAHSPDGIAIDGSGNLWYNSSASGTLYEMVGAGAPVVTPLANAVVNGSQGTEP